MLITTLLASINYTKQLVKTFHNYSYGNIHNQVRMYITNSCDFMIFNYVATGVGMRTREGETSSVVFGNLILWLCM